MSKENQTKLLELYTLCAIKKSGVQFKDIKRIVETKMNNKIDDQALMKVIENLIAARFLEKKNGIIYPKYDYENVLSEISCLALEVRGPLQLRDLSHYILKEIEENVRISTVEKVIKTNRYIRTYMPTVYDTKKISTLYLLPQQLEDVGYRIREYKEPSLRFELRRKLGILSEEEIAEAEKKIKKEIKERAPISPEEIIDLIEKEGKINLKISTKFNLPEKKGAFKSPKISLHPRTWEYLKSIGVTNLYSHQADAIDEIMSHRDVVVSTSAASGKSYIYIIPVIEKLIEKPNATFLYIAPTKSLAQDQKNKFNEFSRAILGKEIAKTFDGHTPKEERERILSKFPNVILTNEHMLHYVILPNHDKWRKFLKNLEIIIIDEIHWYRGVFGSHVSNIFRRLNILTSYYKSYPTYVCLSATIGNPKEFSEKLVGKEIVVVEKDGSQKHKRLLVFWESPSEDDSLFSDTAQIIGEHIASHLRILFFGRSRNLVEMMTKSVKERLEPKLRELVSTYRAGLTRESRREIEDKFFRGKIRALNSTSAMELGIDVGDLDATLLFGYPGSLSSFWQRANRAGRRDKTALIHYVPMNNPLDQYFLSNPESLLKKKFEDALINPDNEKIVEQHIRCAIDEVGGDFLQGFLNSYDIDLFLNLKKFVELALTYHITSHEQSGISLNPQLDISLRSCTNDYIRIYFNDEVIGETDATRAPKELFPGAIYMAQGEKYLVKDLSFADRKAYVKYYPLDESTVVISKKDISIEEYDTSREIIGREVMVGKGRLNLKEYLIEYLRINNMGDVLERGKLNYEPRRLVVDGIWIIFTNDFKNRHLQIDFPQAMHGLQHMITNLTPIHALCDLADISGASYNRHRNLKGNSGIFVFETNEYGVGIIDTVYNNLENLLTESLSLLTSCPCQNGCPKCIHSPYCSSENKDLDKNETINLIEAILNPKFDS